MNKIIIIAKGSSLLKSNKGKNIDEFDVVIRVNHIPDSYNKCDIGSKTDIFCSRSNDKILTFKDKISHIKYWHTHPKFILEEKTKYILNEINDVEYLDDLDLKIIDDNFSKNFVKEYTKSANDVKFGLSFPDTGISSIVMAINRFKKSDIFISGFDNYKNKNKNIYESKSDKSIFKTPVLLQEIFLKKMINKNILNTY